MSSEPPLTDAELRLLREMFRSMRQLAADDRFPEGDSSTDGVVSALEALPDS